MAGYCRLDINKKDKYKFVEKEKKIFLLLFLIDRKAKNFPIEIRAANLLPVPKKAWQKPSFFNQFDINSIQKRINEI